MKQFDPAKNQHDAANRADKGDLTRTEAAEQAGLSLHQQRIAVRVANVPAEQFESAYSKRPQEMP